MHTSRELIELAKQRLALDHHLTLPMTDYRLGKLMHIRQQNISAWQTGARGIGTEFSAQFAEVCGLPEEYVYACIEHEREKNPAVLRVLESIADAFKGKAAAIVATALLLLGGISTPDQTATAGTPSGVRTVCILCKKRKGRCNHVTRDEVPGSRSWPFDRDTLHRLTGNRLLEFHSNWSHGTRKPPMRRRAAMILAATTLSGCAEQ